MKTKYAEDLAKEYDFTSSEEYYAYIVISLINGQRQQVKNLFNQLNNSDKEYFLNSFLDNSIGYHVSVKNICISELLK